MAADRILDRAYDKPPQLNTTDAGQFRRACDMTDDELARIAAGGVDVARAAAARSEERELTYAIGRSLAGWRCGQLVLAAANNFLARNNKIAADDLAE